MKVDPERIIASREKSLSTPDDGRRCGGGGGDEGTLENRENHGWGGKKEENQKKHPELRGDEGKPETAG